MTPSNGTRIAALAAAALLMLPGGAFAAHHARHRVRSSVSVPQPIIVVPHIYDAGGDGSAAPATSFSLFDPLVVAKALGNDALAQLGLPPLP
jgi:hypothetical protein